MNTRMHQEAFPGEDISDRPPPEESVPGLLALIEGDLPVRALPGRARWSPHERAALRPPATTSRRPSRRAVRDEVRLMVARPGAAARPHALPRPRRTTSRPATCWSSTTPRRSPRRSPPSGRRRRRRPAPLHARSRRNPDRLGRRAARATATAPARGPRRCALPAGGTARLLAPYLAPGRLWVAQLDLPEPLLDYLRPHGAPIRYAHEPTARPLEDHQTIFATEPGSAEMPSAGRPFTKRALDRACASAASASSASCCTPASAPRSAASARTRSASRSRRTPPTRVNAARRA